MLQQQTKKRKGGRGPTRFRGITEDAAKLGVSRVTLWRALDRQWELPKLVERYRRLKRSQLKEAA